jgi:hypothetical protein
MNRRFLVIQVSSSALLLAMAMLGTGCGTDSASNGSTGAGGGGGYAGSGAGSSGDVAGGSSNQGGGSGGSSAASDASTNGYHGQVVFAAFHFIGSALFYANFYDPNHPSPPSPCTSIAYGPCNVTECPLGDGAAVPSVWTEPHAGSITASGGDAGFSMTINPDANGQYVPPLPKGPSLSGGELLEFKATGGDVPAFDETVENPLVFLLSEPALPDGGAPLSVGRSQDLKLVWTRGIPDGLFLVQASGRNAATASVTFACSVTADKGTMTIPSAALSRMPGQTPLQIFTVRQHLFKTGAYDVTILVGTDVTTPDKRAPAKITLN